ncbi:MAG TPA: hypothetical protein VGI83_05865, partial [Gemmatimonadales bacterium]
ALEPVLKREIDALANLPLVQETRSAGLLAAVEFTPEALARNPKLPDLAVAESRKRGLITRALVGKALQVSPAFVITEQEIAQIASILREVISSIPG